MGLTLGSSPLSAGGGGVNPQQVVQDFSEYEYLGKVDSTASASILVTQGIDPLNYSGYKFHLVDIKPSTQVYLYYKILKTGGSPYSTAGFITIKQSTSRTYDNTSTFSTATIVATGGSNRFSGEIEVDCKGSSFIHGRHSLAWDNNYNGFSQGGFSVSSATSGFGGISLHPSSGTFTSGGQVLIYGRRDRA